MLIYKSYEGLPDVCYGELPTTGEIIIIKKGESGHLPTKKKGKLSELNEELGVSKIQAEAMFVGAMFGWDIPGADPRNYNKDGIYNK